jgi:thiol-disulfide isomerase/thioredoxin
MIALALLPAMTAWASAIAALALLLLFIGGITVNLARGRTPNCHCFGQLHSQPIGRATLIRNGLLALLAALIVAQGPDAVGPGLFSWLASLSATGYFVLIGSLLALALIAGQSWVVFNLLRQNGRLLLRLEALESHLGLSDPTAEGAPQIAPVADAPKGLAVGTLAPVFQLPALNGTEQALPTLLSAGKPLLLLFSSAECGPCVELMGEVAQWQRTHADKLTIALVNRGNGKLVRAKASALNPATVLLQQENEVAAAYLVTGTPSAVLIGTDGKIRSPLAAGVSAIRELVKNATQPMDKVRELLMRRAPIQLEAVPSAQPVAKERTVALPVGLPIDSVAPVIQLPNLDGTTVDVATLRGAPTLLLFWNPNCGFCRRMVSDLQAWENETRVGRPRLVLISTGTAEANRAVGLRSTILLEEGFRTGFAFGATGTPSAVLLDAQGKVASETVVGASRIMAMLNVGLGEEVGSNQPRVAQRLAA